MLPSIPYQAHTKTIDTFEFEYKPFNVGMENILLMIKDSKNLVDIFSAILQLEDECLIGKWKGKAKSLPSYIAEMLFIELRKISNGTEIPITLRCNNELSSVENGETIKKPCGHEITHLLNLDDVKLIKPEGFKRTFVIEANPQIFVKLREISAGEYNQDFTDISTSKGLYRHLESITQGDQVFGTEEISEEEFSKWCNDMPLSTKAEIAKYFFGCTPYISMKMQFVCPNENCKHTQEMEFTSILDFFTS